MEASPCRRTVRSSGCQPHPLLGSRPRYYPHRQQRQQRQPCRARASLPIAVRNFFNSRTTFFCFFSVEVTMRILLSRFRRRTDRDRPESIRAAFRSHDGATFIKKRSAVSDALTGNIERATHRHDRLDDFKNGTLDANHARARTKQLLSRALGRIDHARTFRATNESVVRSTTRRVSMTTRRARRL